MRIELPDEAATMDLGAWLWGRLESPCLIFLQGDLGAGKTTLVRGFLRAAGFLGTVKSPTYTLVEEYPLGKMRIFHFDLYRLADPDELEWIGIRDYLGPGNVCFVEWPARGEGVLPSPDLLIELVPQGSGRVLALHGLSESGRNLEEALQQNGGRSTG